LRFIARLIGFKAIFEPVELALYPEFLWVVCSQLQTPCYNQLKKETQQVIFIDEGQDAVRGRVQAVKAIAQNLQSKLSAIDM
jgi:hypothetical protein